VCLSGPESHPRAQVRRGDGPQTRPSANPNASPWLALPRGACAAFFARDPSPHTGLVSRETFLSDWALKSDKTDV
ncbi:MAG TPA: hypothetical protein VL996_05270, partial [Methylocella sp.]|nr:hypothetical protein [Methylocella sp.]